MNHDNDPSGTWQEPEFAYHADVGAERLARVYAESLLDAAGPGGPTREILDEMDALLDGVLAHNAELEEFFRGAAAGRAARAGVLEKVFAHRAGAAFYKFLMVLNEHERLDLLRPIRQALHALNDERQNRTEVHVFTAVPLPAGYDARVAETIRQRFNVEPVLVPHVDPTLLGGMKIRIGDQQYDASVRTRLDTLRNQVIARSSYEIQSRRDHFRTD